jgi:purine-binding chemotaxis protein CheW
MAEVGDLDRLSAEDEKILKDRAKQLIEAKNDLETFNGEQVKDTVLGFRLFSDFYCLSLDTVQEIVPVERIIHPPEVPGHIIGLSRLRGAMIALIDLRRFWLDHPLGREDSDLVIVNSIPDQQGIVEFGVVCSEVDGLVEVSPEDLDEIPSNLSPKISACLKGVVQGKYLWINPKNLLNQKGFRVAQSNDSEWLT